MADSYISEDVSGTNPEAVQMDTLDGNTGGDIEDGKVEPPPKPSLSQILSNPCDYLSLIVFMGCGGLGLIFVICAAASLSGSLGIPVALCLIVLGFWSAYEIRMLAALKKELNELNAVQENLKEQVGRLTEEVKLYDQQNERFKEETKELEEANAEFQKQVEELDQTSQELTQAKDEFEAHNQELAQEKESLSASVDSMQGNLGRLTEQTNELESQYKQFQELQEQIQKYAQKNGYDMTVALEKQNEMFEKLETVMRDNAATLLQQIAADMEFADDSEGMSREEYDKWYDRIPQRFKDMLKEKNITFDTFKGTDETIDFEEMSKLIEDLLKESQSDL